jgi:hypothetical protein
LHLSRIHVCSYSASQMQKTDDAYNEQQLCVLVTEFIKYIKEGIRRMHVRRTVSTIRSTLNAHGASEGGPAFVTIQKLFCTAYFAGPIRSYRVGFIILLLPDKDSTDSFRSTECINYEPNSSVQPLWLPNRIPTFRVNGGSSSSRIETSNVLGHFVPWRWGYYVTSKRRDPIMQWRKVISQKNRILRPWVLTHFLCVQYLTKRANVISVPAQCNIYTEITFQILDLCTKMSADAFKILKLILKTCALFLILPLRSYFNKWKNDTLHRLGICQSVYSICYTNFD